MHFYLVLGARGGRRLIDVFAAVELLKEVSDAKAVGLAPFNAGIVYQASKPVREDVCDALGIVEWV